MADKSEKAKKAAKLAKELTSVNRQRLVVGELLEELISVWGGTKAFAKSYHTEYHAAKIGSLMRTKMLDSMTKLFIAHTSKEPHSAKVEDYTEAEMEAATAALLSGVELD